MGQQVTDSERTQVPFKKNFFDAAHTHTDLPRSRSVPGKLRYKAEAQKSGRKHLIFGPPTLEFALAKN